MNVPSGLLETVPFIGGVTGVDTTVNGAPIGDNQNSLTAGENGSVLLQDVHLIQKLQRFARERIPERVVHARGTGAHGNFVSSADFSHLTASPPFNKAGKKTTGEAIKAELVVNQYKENLFKIDFEGELPAESLAQTKIITQKDQSITVQLNEGDDSNALLRHLIQKNVHIHSFNEILPTLNEIFIKKVEER